MKTENGTNIIIGHVDKGYVLGCLDDVCGQIDSITTSCPITEDEIEQLHYGSGENGGVMGTQIIRTQLNGGGDPQALITEVNKLEEYAASLARKYAPGTFNSSASKNPRKL